MFIKRAISLYRLVNYSVQLLPYYCWRIYGLFGKKNACAKEWLDFGFQLDKITTQPLP